MVSTHSDWVKATTCPSSSAIRTSRAGSNFSFAWPHQATYSSTLIARADPIGRPLGVLEADDVGDVGLAGVATHDEARNRRLGSGGIGLHLVYPTLLSLPVRFA